MHFISCRDTNEITADQQELKLIILYRTKGKWNNSSWVHQLLEVDVEGHGYRFTLQGIQGTCRWFIFLFSFCNSCFVPLRRRWLQYLGYHQVLQWAVCTLELLCFCVHAVCRIMSCLSIFSSNNLEAQVTFQERLVKLPFRPALVHKTCQLVTTNALRTKLGRIGANRFTIEWTFRKYEAKVTAV